MNTVINAIRLGAEGALVLVLIQACNLYEDRMTEVTYQLSAIHEALEIQKQEQETVASAPDIVYSPVEMAGNRTLAVRNRNPFNVKAAHSGDKWLGQIGLDKQGHVIFDSWEHGVRAAAHVLVSYEKKHGIVTIDSLVSRFAEGNQAMYKTALSHALHIGIKDRFSIHRHLPALMKIMCKVECGLDLPDKLIVPYTIMEQL